MRIIQFNAIPLCYPVFSPVSIFIFHYEGPQFFNKEGSDVIKVSHQREEEKDKWLIPSSSPPLPLFIYLPRFPAFLLTLRLWINVTS